LAEEKKGPAVVPMLINAPLEFDYDPDTGLVSLTALASFARRQTKYFEVPESQMAICLLLTPETAQSLLADLPKLEALLSQASKGPTKPDFLQ
jgi:hypothetical protein